MTKKRRGCTNQSAICRDVGVRIPSTPTMYEESRISNS